MDPNRILILDRDTGEVVDRCGGPGANGGCPREHAGPVACAGRLLRVVGAPDPAQDFLVPGDFNVCPVTWVMALTGAASESFLDS